MGGWGLVLSKRKIMCMQFGVEKLFITVMLRVTTLNFLSMKGNYPTWKQYMSPISWITRERKYWCNPDYTWVQ